MSVKHHHHQYILAAAGDHEVLEQAVENFRKLFAGGTLTSGSLEIANLQWLLGTKLPHHFSYEEAQVFPSLAADEPETQLQLDELCREHAAILKEAQRLQKLLGAHDLPEREHEVWSAMLDLFADLQKHTGKEDKLFGPYIVQKK